MKVYEISILTFLMTNIESNDAFVAINRFIDSGLAQDKDFLELHNQNKYKNYCFCSFYPLEKDKIYKSGQNYTIRIRTIDPNLAKYFQEKLVHFYNRDIKGLTSKIRILPQKPIDQIYSLTPAVLKTEEGYWRNQVSLNEFERRLKENLIKKYNNIMDTNIDENFQLYTSVEFTNRKPVAINYKGRKILGDKIKMHISHDETAQNLAYMSLGTGLLEMNSRGAGYMNVKWI